MQGFPFFPDQASTFAGPVDLLYFVLVALSLLFAGVLPFVILFLIIRYHRSQKVDRSNASSSDLRLELTWSIIPLILAMGVFFWGAFLYIQMRTPPKEAIDVYVIGKQWMWHAQHSNGKRENNELHVPIGRPVRLIMTSQDVIHSFYIPAFRVKQDVLPGRYTTMWFEATRAGEYHLFCAEYCGTNHSVMGGTVTVMSLKDYQAWLTTPGQVILPDGTIQQGQPLINTNAIPTPAVGTSLGDPMAVAGQQLFNKLGCAGCHNANGSGIGPSLTNVFGYDQALADGSTVPADENYIRESILNSTAKVVKGYQPVMPPYVGQLTDDQVNQLLAYVKTLSNRGATAPESVPQATAAPDATGSPAATTAATTAATAATATKAPTATVAATAASAATPTAAAAAPSGPFDANLAAQGQQVFTNLGCAGCHQASGGIGPSLTGVYGSQVALEGGSTVTADEAYIRESIQNSTAKVVKGYQPIMPVYGSQISDDQLKQLVEYVKSLGAGN
jgi:cytochrome c oxidase subunit 2